METKTAIEILALITALEQNNWWFVGQKKWSARLSLQVLKLENDLRSTSQGSKPKPSQLGIVFIEDISELDETLLNECQRAYIFNDNTQIHIIQLQGQDVFWVSRISDCCTALKTIHPVQIRPANNQRDPHPYLFASLLGSIPDKRIGVRLCRQHNLWRFYHE